VAGKRSSYNLLSVLPHVTPRDLQLIAMLDQHRVLTTDQVHRLLFQAERTCQLRLAELRDLALVERFRFHRPSGGTFPWHWTLGLNGHRFAAAAAGRAEPTARSAAQLVARMSANPHLPHLLACNEFFVRLAAHARRSPAARLPRWWSEARATAEFQMVRPDGHGIWTVDERTVGFFLECDRNTEAQRRLVGKFAAYERLAATVGAHYPVLLWLSSPERERAVQTTLRREPPAVPVATATHDSDPAGPVWLPVHGTVRVGLHQMESSHGRASAANPNYRDGQLHLHGDTAYPWS